MAGLSAKGTKLYMSEKGVEAKIADKIANVVSIGAVGGEIEEIDVTDLDSGDYKEFAPGFRDSGSVDVVLNFSSVEKIKVVKDAHDSGAYMDFGIALPGEVAELSEKFTGFIKSFKRNDISSDALIQYTLTIRISGGISKFTTPVA